MAVIHGTVVDLAGRPGADRRVAVLAWAHGSAFSTLLAQGFADREGRFRLDYPEPLADTFLSACALDRDGVLLGWSENLAGAPADALVRVVLGAGGPTPLAADRPEDTAVDLPLPAASQTPPPAPSGEEFAVCGTVAWPDGTPAIGIAVRAVDRDLRGEQPLGPFAPDYEHETRTDPAGYYRIPYLGKQFSQDEIASADLVVRALDGAGRVAAASPTLFNAPREATVDLVLATRAAGLPAEYERVLEAVGRLLGLSEYDFLPAAAGRISAADVPFLAGETGIPAERFSALIASAKLVPTGPDEAAPVIGASPATGSAGSAGAAGSAGTAAGAETAVPGEVYYGLIRVGCPTDWAGLVALTADQIATNLDDAVDRGIVADSVRGLARRYADALLAKAKQAQDAQIAQGAGLADPATRYASTGSVNNTLVDSRLDQALNAAVQKAIGVVPADLATAIAPALEALSWRSVEPQTTIATCAVDVLTSAATLDPAIGPAAQTAIGKVNQQAATTVSDALSLDTALRDNPLLANDVRIATTSALAGAAGLSGPALSAVTAAAAGLAAAPEQTLATLTAAGSLTTDQASAVQTMLDLGNLTDANVPLIQTLSAQGAASPAVLASWTAAKWQQVLGAGAGSGSGSGSSSGGTAGSVTLPPGISAADYADLMVANLELTYPTQALAAQLAPGNTTVSAFFSNNPQVDLRTLDLARSDVSSLNWQGVSDADRPQVETELRSYQRLLALADTTADRVSLSRNGFDSAFAISALSEQQFTAKSGLDAATARLTYARAIDLASIASHAYGAVHDVIRVPWPKMPVGTAYPDFIDDLLKIQGMAKLFGSQDYCDCGDCDSVLSAAAYFVDLMHFIEQQVSTPVYVTPGLTGHPLYLKNRRPDLWTLPLTCDNTNTLIPTLQLVDEVLDSYLTKVLGTDPYQYLADPTDKATCALPVNLPYAELGLYLGYFSLTPADVYRTLQLPDATIDGALTGLSADEATIVATADETGIVTRLGLTAASGLDNLPVQTYLERMALTRDQLTTLLASRYNPDLANVTVVQEPASGQIQDFPEFLHGLTAARADAAFRFVRLARPLSSSWALGDLDLVLLAAQQAGVIGTSLDAPTVQLVGRLLRVQSQLSVIVQQLCAVIGDMPVSTSFPVPPTHTSDRLLYEQVFDLTNIFGVKNTTTGELNQSCDYYEYTLDTTLGTGTPTIDHRTPLLLAGLGISETDLLQLFSLLKAQVPFTTAGHATLSRGILSLLYRHAAIARTLGLSVTELIAALSLLFPATGLPLTTLAQVEQLIAFNAWVGSSDFSVEQLQLILTGVASASAPYANTLQTVSALIQSVQAADVPSGGTAPDPLATLRTKLGVVFNAGAGRLADMLTWTGQDITAPPIHTALTATFTNGVPNTPADVQPLLVLVQRLERVALLFAQLQSSDDTVDYLTASFAKLGVADRTILTYADIQALSAYAGYCARTIAPAAETTPLPTSGAAGSNTNAETVARALLDAYAAAGSFGPDQHSPLALLTSAEPSLVDSVLAAIALPAVPISALNRADQVVATGKLLGLNAYSLLKLGQDGSFADLTAAAQVAIGAAGAQYTDQAVRATAMAPYQDKVNALRRDALCGYLIDGRPELHFTTQDDLYDYFLIDVEMGGCGRTSRLVSAISSVQLYVQRCLMNLEQTDPAITTAPQVHVDPTLIPQDQWAWRQNFRVWQANREVFLYPESYMDPNLRDDKTPVFEDLESTLLQQQITDATVTDAYSGYLASLSELAHLKIIGTLLDKASKTYYFFGRTQQDPATIFYRTWDGTTWLAWTKINLPIDGPYISASIHLGRLFVFWVDITSKDHTSISGGDSNTDYATVAVSLAYSSLGPDGSWHAPQKIEGLYPTPQELFTATNQVYPGSDGDVDNAVASMELQKLCYKAFPYAVGESIVLRYYNETLNSNYYYDRQLDLFHNRLINGGGIPGPSSGTPVGFYITGNSTVLGLETRSYSTELEFDVTREQGDSVVTPHTAITTSFSYDNRNVTDPNHVFYAHAVHNGFPESVILIGDQQFLVHDNRTILVPGLPYTIVPQGSSDQRQIQDTDASRFGTDYQLTGSQTPGIQAGSVQTGSVQTGSSQAGSSQTSGGQLEPKMLYEKPPLMYTYVTPQDPILFTPVNLPAQRSLIRLSTSVADQLGQTEAEGGVDRLLALATQQAAVEKPLPFKITAPSQLAPPADDPHHVNLAGAFGGYYQELFFHIPWLIANQLNAAGQYQDAMRWYQWVFDPTASESPSDTSPADRVWRYVGFRGLTVPTLEQIITDPAALAAYRDDPFNPFAIARLRPSAFQKAMVTAFVDNLINWGDSLFSQYTTESVNEATLLYVLAAEILGPRPADLGECATVPEAELTYAAIGPTLGSTSDFLVTLENWVYQTKWTALDQNLLPAMTTGAAAAATTSSASASASASPASSTPVMTELKYAPMLLPFDAARDLVSARNQIPITWQTQPIHQSYPPGLISQTTLAFCVPPNQTLLGYWDTVDDRLSKIRSCKNISGTAGQLALFAPPINPMDLVRAVAAGLSVEQATALLSAPVPAYRFSSVIERARAAAESVRALGGSLQSALEHKDAEELTLLLSLHQRTILNLTTAVKNSQVEEAQDLQAAQVDAETNAQGQVDYYQNLLSNGLTAWETVEEASRNTATGIKTSESVVHLTAAITYLIPQIGSPFAMKYGGVELGHSGVQFAEWNSAMAEILTHVADSASMEARFDRREEEWRHQLQTALQQLDEAHQRTLAAGARVDFAQADLTVHQKSIDQAAALDAFYQNKFTNLGLYTHLARTLTQLHRMAYDAAYQLAMNAQQAYRFELDDSTMFIAPDNWQGNIAGLLSGETLVTQLQQLENAYLAGNTRRYEVTQLFPLTVVSPSALLDLRQTGSCTFDLPEILFDVVYPGQFKRLVKSVRLTVPGVTGPYTTVGAKLTMTGSSVRTDPAAALTAMPAQPNIASAIATSTAVGDGGVFDLNFRDERYLPFEGAGAVSSWRLDLPSQLRSFDYQTISDVVVHLSYTALDDDTFRTTVETGLVSELKKFTAANGVYRLLSLRFDFPAAFNQLTGGTAPVNMSTSFPMEATRFPYFLSSSTLDLSSVQLYLLPQGAGAGPVDTSGLNVTLNGTAAAAWTVDPATGLATSSVPLSGPAIGTWTLATTSGQIDPAKIADVVMLVRCKTA